MKRRYDYDVLRVFSMLCVIYLHVASKALRMLENRPLWHFSNLIVAAATSAVPLFLMMSGSLLLEEEKTADLRRLFTRRIPRVLVPLLVWSGLVIAYSALKGDTAGALASLRSIFSTPVVTPYWFIYAIVPIYLLSPLLKRMCDGLSGTHWRYMMALWLVCSVGLSTLRSFAPAEWAGIFQENWVLNLNLVGGYLGYFLLGAFLERQERIPSRKVLAAVAMAAAVVIALGTWWDTYSQGAYSERFTSYLGFPNVILSSAIFLLAKRCLRGRQGRGKVLPLLAGCSFGVYLAHVPAIKVWENIWELLFSSPELTAIPQQVLFFLCVAASCIVGAVIAASIPGVCFLLTGQRFREACKGSNLQSLFRRKTAPEP